MATATAATSATMMSEERAVRHEPIYVVGSRRDPREQSERPPSHSGRLAMASNSMLQVIEIVATVDTMGSLSWSVDSVTDYNSG